MDQPTADLVLRELDRFVGEWTMTAAPPGDPPWPGESRVRFEWPKGAGSRLASEQLNWKETAPVGLRPIP